MFIKIPELFSARNSASNTTQRSNVSKPWTLSTNIQIISQYVDRSAEQPPMPHNTTRLHSLNCPATKSTLSLQGQPAEQLGDSKPNSQIACPRHKQSSSISSTECAAKLSYVVKPLDRLFRTAKKVFSCNLLTVADLEMSRSEIGLLLEVVNKKFVVKKIGGGRLADSGALNKVELVEELNNCIQSHGSTKRIEENNKFVYKYTFKYLRQRFYVKEGLKKSIESEVLFYRYYFEESAANMKITLDHFFDPLYKVCNKNPHYKSINNKYLSLIFSSPIFKSDFFDFLKLEFKTTYVAIIHSKLRKFFKKLRNELTADRSAQFSSALIDRFVEKLRKNKKCKLPWTIEEVSSGLSHFQSLIYYY